MNKLKNLLMGLLFVGTTTLASCGALGFGTTVQDNVKGLVFTSQESLVAGADFASVPEVPDEVRSLFPEGTNLGLARSEDVIPGSFAISPEDPDSLVDAGIGLAAAFIPGLAAWEGVLALLFKRKRTHYANAFKSAMPFDGTVKLGDAGRSLVAALGVSHSSPATKEVFEEDLEVA